MGVIKDVQNNAYITLTSTIKIRTNILNKHNYTGDKMLKYIEKNTNRLKFVKILQHKFNPVI